MAKYYEGNLRLALLKLFPDIGMEERKFANLGNYWDDTDNQRKLFEDYAAFHEFDPLIAENWYQITSSPVYEFKVFEQSVSIC